MDRSNFAYSLLRALGGIVGVAILIGFAFAMARVVGGAGVSLSL